MNTTATIITIISSITTWFVANKWLFPYLEKVIKYFINKKHEKDKETLEVNKELIETKELTNNVYESQINWFSKQVSKLQTLIDNKESELDEFIIQIDILKDQIEALKKQITDYQIEMKKYACYNVTCQFRCDKKEYKECNK
ncbi:hypothetical protein [uncultured Bacteroides sp.]|uniref:coiled-coil domain-containing protein n=1 Tax=uncultured Bacteroides sp. TaxID=162156 RepID=UPI002AA80C0A|nr:hypothetical protein [uncultured Bacteroides sp.]